jgi:hypothetical protein
MQINKISQAMQGELRKVDGVRKPGRPESTVKAATTDRSELSASGKMEREVKGEMQIISSMVRAQPDVRADKVLEARSKVDMGFYGTESFADKLASKLAGAIA